MSCLCHERSNIHTKFFLECAEAESILKGGHTFENSEKCDSERIRAMAKIFRPYFDDLHKIQEVRILNACCVHDRS